MEELIKLADEIGFTSKFLYSRPFKYSPEKEQLRKLFWLIELRQHIQKSFGVYVGIIEDGYWEYNINKFYFSWWMNNRHSVSKISYNNEVDALEAGLIYFITEITTETPKE